MEFTKSRSKGSLHQFIPKKTCKRMLKSTTFFSFGNWYTNNIHTKLRNYCILNYELCKWSIIDGPLDSCGKHEGLYHFFFACKNYSIGRNTLLDWLFRHELVNYWYIFFLICSDVNLHLQINNIIFADVHKFID